jgi:hypothetical protein
MRSTPSPIRKRIAGVALVGAIAGAGVMAAAAAANAADSTPSATTSSTAPAAGGTVDETKSVRSDEHLLTGTDATNATAAALAKYPGATIQRVETDSAGVYEAHLVTAAGERLIVQMDATFTVTGNETGGPADGTHSPADGTHGPSDGTRGADPTDAPSATTAG